MQGKNLDGLLLIISYNYLTISKFWATSYILNRRAGWPNGHLFEFSDEVAITYLITVSI